MHLVDLQETVPISATGMLLGFEGSRTCTTPGFTLETLELNAISTDFQV